MPSEFVGATRPITSPRTDTIPKQVQFARYSKGLGRRGRHLDLRMLRNRTDIMHVADQGGTSLQACGGGIPDRSTAADTTFARDYVGSPSGPVPGPPNPYTWGTVGAGGVWTTVGDIYRWVVAVEQGEVVPHPYRALLFSPPPTPSDEAYGWHVYPETDTSRARIEKGGGSDDFASQLMHFPDDGVTIVWASNNLERRWRQTLNRALPDLIFTGTTQAPLPR